MEDRGARPFRRAQDRGIVDVAADSESYTLVRLATEPECARAAARCIRERVSLHRAPQANASRCVFVVNLLARVWSGPLRGALARHERRRDRAAGVRHATGRLAGRLRATRAATVAGATTRAATGAGATARPLRGRLGRAGRARDAKGANNSANAAHPAVHPARLARMNITFKASWRSGRDGA